MLAGGGRESRQERGEKKERERKMGRKKYN
jgi:hypothetical protein